MLHGSQSQGTKKKEDEKEGKTARAAVQPMDRNENGFPLFPFPSYVSVSIPFYLLFFFPISFSFLPFPVSCQGFRCVRGALHRRLFLYVHIDTKAAQRRMHTVPQARKRPSSVLIVFCCLYYSQFLFVFLHFICLSVCCLSVCLFVCLSVCLSV